MLDRLTLSDFRSHEDALIVPRHRFVVLTGENGAGKTNILEAVSLLVPGRGLRGAPIADMARQGGSGGFGIAAQVDGVTIGTGVAADTPGRRQVRINGENVAANALAERLAMIWLTPAMDRLFVDSAGGRRRFLDRLVLALHPAHAVHAARYEAAMRARNKLLQQGGGADPAWLNALEAQMAEHGEAIARARADLADRLDEAMASGEDGPFPRPSVNLIGWTPGDVPLDVQLRSGRRRDASAGRALSGPHRTDLAVVHVAKQQAASLCSTGEQKALLLGLLIGHAGMIAQARGRPPVLLLDEVAAHLDPVRRRALFDALAALGGQVWMTGTEPGLFEGLDGGQGGATWLHVGAGRVVPAP